MDYLKKGNIRKMCLQANLKWGVNTSRVLGITFSVNLLDVPNLNYNTIITDAERTLVPWRQRNLTSISKICILKTFIIPKFVTLFMTIPRKSSQTIKSLNKLFYSFIWEFKPDKISRSKRIGGLRMIDIDTFITGLQIYWIKRLPSNETPVWKTVGIHCIRNSLGLQHFGSTWPKNLAQNITNMVWREALLSWACLLDTNIPDEEKKLASPIWYNPRISKMELFLPQWFNKGISFVSDLIDSQGKFLTHRDLKILRTLQLLRIS